MAFVVRAPWIALALVLAGAACSTTRHCGTQPPCPALPVELRIAVLPFQPTAAVAPSRGDGADVTHLEARLRRAFCGTLALGPWWVEDPREVDAALARHGYAVDPRNAPALARALAVDAVLFGDLVAAGSSCESVRLRVRVLDRRGSVLHDAEHAGSAAAGGVGPTRLSALAEPGPGTTDRTLSRQLRALACDAARELAGLACPRP